MWMAVILNMVIIIFAIYNHMGDTFVLITVGILIGSSQLAGFRIVKKIEQESVE